MEKGQPGIEMIEAHFPGQAPIDAYGNGGFRFADMSHRGSLMCTPSGIYAWNISSLDALSERESFTRVLDEQRDIEILLIGTGHDLIPVSSELVPGFRQAGISADAMATGSAVRTYNVLVAEGRAVAAALYAV